MNIKQIALLCVLMTGASAMAQNAVVTPPPAPGKPATAVNPFTGKPLSDEQLQRELETAKMRTSLLEEMLKQTNLNEEIKTLPVRKAVESAQAETSLKKEAISRQELEDARKAAAASKALELAQLEQQLKDVRAKPKKASAKNSKAPASASEVIEESSASVKPAPAPAAPLVQLTSVLDIGGMKSAVFDINGGTLIVADGADSPMGLVRVMDSGSVEVNGKPYKVHQATLGRVILSDVKAQPALGANSPQSAEAGKTPASSVASALNTKLQAYSSAGANRTPLPPIQMPPGAQSLPGVPTP